MTRRGRLIVGATLFAIAVPGSVLAQPTNEQLAARCVELGQIADRYMKQGGESSGGPNMTRISAGIDCDRGRYKQGIEALEKLLRGKAIPFPPGPG